MCGIVGVFDWNGGLHADTVVPAMAGLHRRGPDGSGVWVSHSGRAVLGHTRLAIIDPECGGQPMVGPRLATCLVANGEFYGHERLRERLCAAGAPVRTHSDSELALHLYERDGVGALRSLRGEFAFALWDEDRALLFAARDRFGIKPMYWAQHAGRIVLASRIRSLFDCGVPCRWDAGAFAAHLQMGIPEDRTMFAGVHQVPPGCYLEADVGGVRIVRYWQSNYPSAETALRYTSEADVAHDIDAVRRAVDDAVATRIRADVPVAFHLSGGLDSSSVLGSARGGSPPRHAFTVGFDDPQFNESAVAVRTAAWFGDKIDKVLYRPDDYVDAVRETVRAGEMVQENSHGIARMAQSRAVRAAGYTVALSGEGGDEMFCGYPQFEMDLELSLDTDRYNQRRETWSKLSDGAVPLHIRRLLSELDHVPTWVLERYMQVTAPVTEVLTMQFGDVLTNTDSAAEMVERGADMLCGRAPVHQSSYLFGRSWLPNYLLVAERLDAEEAVEVRAPLFDHHLAELVGDMPLRLHRGTGLSKPLLRAAMAGRLPAEVLESRKRGFFAPPVLGDPSARRGIRELICGPGRFNPFFDATAVSAVLDDMGADTAGTGPSARAAGLRRNRSEKLLQLAASIGALAEEFRPTDSLPGPVVRAPTPVDESQGVCRG